MSKTNFAEASGKLYELLEPFSSEDRARLITGTLVFLGDAPIESAGPASKKLNQEGEPKKLIKKEAADFFALKIPANKIENIAVASRYLEESEIEAPHSKEQIKSVFKDARQNFDDHNFNRDIMNARASGFFTRAQGENDKYTLAFYGQKYIDALPDREKAKALKKPTKGRAKSAKKKV
jgi:hypothetical protein